MSIPVRRLGILQYADLSYSSTQVWVLEYFRRSTSVLPRKYYHKDSLLKARPNMSLNQFLNSYIFIVLSLYHFLGLPVTCSSNDYYNRNPGRYVLQQLTSTHYQAVSSFHDILLAIASFVPSPTCISVCSKITSCIYIILFNLSFGSYLWFEIIGIKKA